MGALHTRLSDCRFVAGNFIRSPEQLDYLKAPDVFGASIVSSHGESDFALDDPSPHRIGFNLARVMRTQYKIDEYQALYVVVDSFEQLLRTTLDTDFAPLYRSLDGQPDVAIDTLQPGDVVLTTGTQTRA